MRGTATAIHRWIPSAASSVERQTRVIEKEENVLIHMKPDNNALLGETQSELLVPYFRQFDQNFIEKAGDAFFSRPLGVCLAFLSPHRQPATRKTNCSVFDVRSVAASLQLPFR